MSKLTLYNNYMIVMINILSYKELYVLDKTGLLGAISLILFLYLLLYVYMCVVETCVWESRYLQRPEEGVQSSEAAGWSELPDGVLVVFKSSA